MAIVESSSHASTNPTTWAYASNIKEKAPPKSVDSGVKGGATILAVTAPLPGDRQQRELEPLPETVFASPTGSEFDLMEIQPCEFF